jgi:hypothetical protein
MFKRILKWLGAITAVFVIAIAIFLINLDLVPAVELESVLRKGLCGDSL